MVFHADRTGGDIGRTPRPWWFRRRWRSGPVLVAGALAAVLTTAVAVPGVASPARPTTATRMADTAAQAAYTTVRVRSGNTLWGLAGRYATTVRALQSLNNLGGSTRIHTGQALRVPARGSARATTADNGHTFRGIYAFSGGNTADLASDQDVVGRSLVYYWAQLEPKPSVYRWDLIDQDIKPWAAAGKKVILRISAAGWASWDRSADSAHGTPAWVYAHGVKSVTEKDGAVLPQYWNPTFEQDQAAFLAAFAARYDGNPHVAAVDISVGIGGETKPDSEKNPNLLKLWQSIGYTDPLWWSYAQQAITSYTSVFHHTPLALMPDKTFLGNTPGYNEHKILDYAVAKNIWLQDNGVLPGRTLSAPWGQTPVIAEMRGPTSQTGDSLAADLNAALTEHPTFILVFTTDLSNPANRAVIHTVALKAHTGN